MNGGDKTLILLAATALAGCTAGNGQVQVRPIADPAAKFRQGSADVAAARGQLVLGNVGLALEAFRIIQRNRPNDPAAPAGIAECYAQMGRFDLAELNFEQALALAPHDPTLLRGLARIVELQGNGTRAMAIRAEAAAAEAAAAPVIAATAQRPEPKLAVAQVREFIPPQIAHTGSITVALPKARPADRLATNAGIVGSQLAQAAETAAIAGPSPAVASNQTPLQPQEELVAIPIRSRITVELPTARPADRLIGDSDAGRLQLTQAAATIPLGPLAADVVASAKAPVRAAIVQPVQPSPPIPLRSTITVALPPARPTDRIATEARPGRSELAQAAVTVPLQLEAPSAPPGKPRPTPLKGADMPATYAEAGGPRIERISPGEVMLVTTGRPLWRSPTASQSVASNTVRWIPLGNASVRPNVQVLNAARREGIARSARAVLLDRGWRRIKVADAPIVREKSVVLYPRSRPTLGRSLAAQFGVTAQAGDVALPTLLLGRDAPDLVRSQRKS